MRHLLTLLLLACSSLYCCQTARDTMPEAPYMVAAFAAQSYYAQLEASREENNVYICDSQTAKAYHASENCRGLNRCTHEVVKVTKKEAEEEYGRVKCQVCY